MIGPVRWVLYTPTRFWLVLVGGPAATVAAAVGLAMLPSGTSTAAAPTPAPSATSPASTGSPTPAPTGSPSPTATPEPEATPTGAASATIDSASQSAALTAILGYTRAWQQGTGKDPLEKWVAQLQPLAGPDLIDGARSMTRQARDAIPTSPPTSVEFTAATPTGATGTVVLADGTRIGVTAVPADAGRWIVTEFAPAPGTPR